MALLNLPDTIGDIGQPGFTLKRLLPLNSLYGYVGQCGPESLSQALNLYIAQLEEVGLPDGMASDYMLVETLSAVARLLMDSGCTEEVLPENVDLPGFRADGDGFIRCCKWCYEVLKQAMEYRSRYDSRTGNPGIARARYYIDSHYTDAELMLKDAAAEAKMSASRFSTVFAREVGSTFTEYVTNLRIQKACELLTGTPMRISQIAAQVGYNDPHYFSWIFRKTTGRTPTDFRLNGDVD